MKAKLMIALLFAGCFAFGQNSVNLRFKSGQPGFVDDKTLDVATLSDGDTFTVGVYVDDLDFVLAGFEARVDFLERNISMENTDAAFQDGNAPLRKGDAWGGAELVMLPSNSTGDQTAATVNTAFGTFRFGGLPVDPLDRLSGDGATDYCIAEIDFIINKANNCESSEASISLFLCPTGSSDCDIFANDSAQRVAMSFNDTTRTVTVVNTDISSKKGDFDGNGSVDPGDLIPVINCANNLDPCPLDGNPDALIIGDVNCSNNPPSAPTDPGDIIPTINLANRITSRSAGKRATSLKQVNGDGSLVIDNAGLNGAMFYVDIKVDGEVNFKPVSAPNNGWYLSGRYHADKGIYRLIGVNVGGGNLDLPSVEIDYVAGSGAAMGVLYSEYRLSDNSVTGQNASVINTGGPRDRSDDDRVKQ
ncbi:MAG: hypothetical protein QNK37_23420 [Acidobacteriota bacterium]|nr:hypothetical protein [Acidobacteriota bacterium]